MANLDPGPAVCCHIHLIRTDKTAQGTTDQELDDTGFITGFIDGVKLEVVTARGTNAEAKVLHLFLSMDDDLDYFVGQIGWKQRIYPDAATSYRASHIHEHY